LSFFDEGDEPRGGRTATAPRPRRGLPPRPSGGGGGDSQLLVRRGIAIGAVVLVLILLVVGVRGCLSSRKESALKDYNRNVAVLVQESDNSVGKPLFEVLSSRNNAANPLDLQAQVNELKVEADRQYKRAKGLDVPGDMNGAQQNFLLVLDLRRDAVAEIAKRLPTALGNAGAAAAVNQITGQMQAFVASDVIYSQQVVPRIKDALDKNSIGGQTIAQSRFLPNPLQWLDANKVAVSLGTAAGGAAGAPAGKPAPGTHGHGLTSVDVGQQTLQEGTANRITASAALAFNVTFQNQGENDEKNVKVSVSITGAGRPISVEKIVPDTTAGSDATASIPLGQSPPIGTPVTIKVTVAPVPGEESATNNTAEYPAIFTRG
jgi:hypothetical protein